MLLAAESLVTNSDDEFSRFRWIEPDCGRWVSPVSEYNEYQTRVPGRGAHLMTVSLLTTPAAFDSLRLPWHALWLETRDAGLFQTYAWFRAVAVACRQRAALLVVRDGRHVRGLLPLLVDRRRTPWGHAKVLTFPMPSWAPTFGPIGPEPARTWLAVLEYLQSHRHWWDACDWPGIDVAHTDHQRLSTAGHFRGFRFVSTVETAWRAIDLASRPDDAPGSDECHAIVRYHPPRLRIVNPPGAADSSLPFFRPPEPAGGTACGLMADTTSPFPGVLAKVGAASGELLRYDYISGDTVVARWWLALGGQHWAVLGRWRSSGVDGNGVEQALLATIIRDARHAGAARLWTDAGVSHGSGASPRRYRSANLHSWRGLWCRLVPRAGASLTRQAYGRETRRWARVPAP